MTFEVAATVPNFKVCFTLALQTFFLVTIYKPKKVIKPKIPFQFLLIISLFVIFELLEIARSEIFGTKLTLKILPPSIC